MNQCVCYPTRRIAVAPATTSAVAGFDVQEYDDRFEFSRPGPGLDPNTIEVQVHDGVLDVRGQRPAPQEGVRYLHRERPTQPLRLTLRLGRQVDAGQIAARYADGYLYLTLPKVAAAQPRKVEVALN